MKLINKNINLNNYRTFYTVAKLQSFSLAAEELFISQPAISFSIKQLETELNLKLFYHDKNKLFLTKDGEKALIYVEQALYNFNMIEENISKSNGSIAIGSTAHLAIGYIFPYLKDFLEIFPEIELVFETGSVDKLIEKMENHEIDFIIDTFPQDCKYNNIKVRKITDFKKSFIYNNQYFKELNNNTISINDLVNYTLIMPSKTNAYRKEIDKLLYENNVVPKSIIDVASTSLMYKFVNEGLGLGYIIEELIENKEKYNVVKFNNEMLKCEVDLIYIDDYATLMAKKFIDYIIERENKNEKNK